MTTRRSIPYCGILAISHGNLGWEPTGDLNGSGISSSIMGKADIDGLQLVVRGNQESIVNKDGGCQGCI